MKILYLSVAALSLSVALLSCVVNKPCPRCERCRDYKEPVYREPVVVRDVRDQCTELASEDSLRRECYAEDGGWGYPSREGNIIFCKTKDGALMWSRDIEMKYTPRTVLTKIKPKRNEPIRH